MPSLELQLAEVEKFLEENKTYLEAPHIIDVLLPFLCAYLPSWWQHGPDNLDPTRGSHVTMVTSEHLNHLFKLVLRLITKNIGEEKADWLSSIAVYAQQIIINPTEALLRDPILPLAEKCRARVETMFHKEESCMSVFI